MTVIKKRGRIVRHVSVVDRYGAMGGKLWLPYTPFAGN